MEMKAPSLQSFSSEYLNLSITQKSSPTDAARESRGKTAASVLSAAFRFTAKTPATLFLPRAISDLVYEDEAAFCDSVGHARFGSVNTELFEQILTVFEKA